MVGSHRRIDRLQECAVQVWDPPPRSRRAGIANRREAALCVTILPRFLLEKEPAVRLAGQFLLGIRRVARLTSQFLLENRREVRLTGRFLLENRREVRLTGRFLWENRRESGSPVDSCWKRPSSFSARGICQEEVWPDSRRSDNAGRKRPVRSTPPFRETVFLVCHSGGFATICGHAGGEWKQPAQAPRANHLCANR